VQRRQTSTPWLIDQPLADIPHSTREIRALNCEMRAVLSERIRRARYRSRV